MNRPMTEGTNHRAANSKPFQGLGKEMHTTCFSIGARYTNDAQIVARVREIPCSDFANLPAQSRNGYSRLFLMAILKRVRLVYDGACTAFDSLGNMATAIRV